jgi:plasmid stabilization system protein ParE
MSQSDARADEEPTIYAIRFYERASRDIDAVVVYLADNLSESFARDWFRGINKAIRSLSELPERYALAPEPHFAEPTRNLTWSRPKSRVSHRILYRVRNDSNDGAVVMILHIRGATMAPITPEEVREIEAQQ